MIKNWGTINEEISLKQVVKSAGIAVFGQLHIYNLVKEPILIFSNRRSGSTLLMRMIASQPGVDFCGQPLSLWRAHPHFKRLPHPSNGRFIVLDEDDESLLYRYFEDLLSGNIRVFNEWNPFSPSFSFFVDRLAIKILSANTLIDWFDGNFDVKVVYLVRHPVPVALSLIRRNWGNDARAYLENKCFCTEYLDAEQVDFGWRVLEHGTPLQRYVLEWCLGNIQPLRLFRQRSWLTLAYEEIILRPEEMSELICSRLGLPDPMRMRKVMLEASRTTTQQSRLTIREKGPAALVDKWMREIEPSDAAGANEVLESLGIRAYDAFSARPHPDLCHFGPLGDG